MRGAAHFVRQLLWLLEPHFDSRIVPAWLSAQIPAGDQWQQCLLVLHALDHWQYQFLSWRVGALALILDGQAVSRGSCEPEPPAFEQSDWRGLPVWPVVVRVQGCHQAVAWMLEQVIAVAFWTELSLHWP